MPLSEDEQRILQDIERNFYEQDPSFARSVSGSTSYEQGSRNCKLAGVGFVLGLITLLATFTWLPAAAFAGFLVMMASAGVFAVNLRRCLIGGAASKKEPSNSQGKGSKGFFGKFRRD